MSSLLRMTSHRIKKVLAWLLAIVVLALIGAGLVFVVTEVF